MTIEEMLRIKEKKWKAEGKAEAVIELLEDIDTVPDEIREKILNESDLEVLRRGLLAIGNLGPPIEL